MNSNSITVALSRPVTDDSSGKEYTAFTFEEATAGMAMATDAVTGATGKTVALLAGMAGVSLPLMRKVALKDISRIVEEVADLMGESSASKAAGSTS